MKRGTLLGLLAVCLLALPLSAARGPIMIMGIDGDVHYTSGTQLTEIEGVISTMYTNACNDGAGILVVGGGKDQLTPDTVTGFWNAFSTDTSIPITFVNGAVAVSNQSFAGFGMIAVVNAFQEGNLTQEENNALSARHAEIDAFNASGGALFAFSQDTLISDVNNFGPYAWLTDIATVGNADGLGLCNIEFDYGAIETTPEGVAQGITTDFDVDCWHDHFITWPSKLTVYAWVLNHKVDQDAAVLGFVNTAPSFTSCPTDVTVECTGGSASTKLSAGVTDVDGDALTVTWNVDSGAYTEPHSVPAGGPPTSATDDFTHTYALGDHTVVVSVNDGCGPVSCASMTVHVVDTTKPVVTSSVATTILSNDHTMKDVGFSDSATDTCQGSLPVAVEVWANEQEQAPTSTGGDGTTSPDARGPGTCHYQGNLRLRQERLNNGSGRIYLIKTSATDGSNNTGWSCVTVVSPRSNKKNDINKVLAAASAVATVCNQFGAIPTNYYHIGSCTEIGSKQ